MLSLSLMKDREPPWATWRLVYLPSKLHPSLPVSCSLVPICFVMLPLKLNNYACGRNNFNRLTLSPRTHSHADAHIPPCALSPPWHLQPHHFAGQRGEGGELQSSRRGVLLFPATCHHLRVFAASLITLINSNCFKRLWWGSGAEHAGSTCRWAEHRWPTEPWGETQDLFTRRQ